MESMQNDSAAALEEKVVDALRTVYDPEIPVNIHELGLVYGIDIDSSGAVAIRMTLTSPGCPVAVSLPPEVEAKVREVPGVTSAKVKVTPGGTKSRCSNSGVTPLWPTASNA